MYAGTTFGKRSGKIIGVHQKIDRVARRQLNRHIPKSSKFPGIREIIHFEGSNGPDAIKHGRSSQDEPWYFIDPTNPNDNELLTIIHSHMVNLAEALKTDNNVRAAFESAWLAHAVVDGLTPAHHYPLSDKIEQLWGKPRRERSSLKDKGIIRGANRRDTVVKNWEYWGTKGVLTAHLMFEMGAASAIATDKFKNVILDDADIDYLKQVGFDALFLESVNKIYDMKMYDEFGKKGWTRPLANKTKKILIPEMIRVVALSWYQAANMAEEIK